MLQWLTSTTVGKLAATFVISMLPVVELRGGIPYGVGFGLNPWVAFLAAMLGNIAINAINYCFSNILFPVYLRKIQSYCCFRWIVIL